MFWLPTDVFCWQVEYHVFVPLSKYVTVAKNDIGFLVWEGTTRCQAATDGTHFHVEQEAQVVSWSRTYVCLSNKTHALQVNIKHACPCSTRTHDVPSNKTYVCPLRNDEACIILRICPELRSGHISWTLPLAFFFNRNRGT